MKLDAFVVASPSMDSAALAINEQRFAAEIKNVVSAQEFGARAPAPSHNSASASTSPRSGSLESRGSFEHADRGGDRSPRHSRLPAQRSLRRVLQPPPAPPAMPPVMPARCASPTGCWVAPDVPAMVPIIGLRSVVLPTTP